MPVERLPHSSGEVDTGVKELLGFIPPLVILRNEESILREAWFMNRCFVPQHDKLFVITPHSL